MADLAFALHLGNGVYLDSEGNIHHGAVPATLIYEAEFKLPIDPKKAADALKSVSEALKDIDKSPEIVKKITDIYGFFFAATKSVDTKALLSLLSGIGKVAGTIAPILFVVSFAFDLAKMFNQFFEGETALEKLVKKRFTELNDQFDVIAQLIQASGMVAGRDAISALTADASDYVDRLRNVNPNPAQLQEILNKVDKSMTECRPGIQRLLDPQTWRTLFNPAKHSQVWGLMQHHLFLLPGGPPVPARLPPHSNQFDHRLMVPLASYAGLSFLAGLRVLSPEYRSTGHFRHTLHNFANDIAHLAQSMRTEVLARTIYEPKDFSVLLYPAEVIQTDDFFDPKPIAISPSCSRFPVGALDLRYHDNLFFEAFLAQLTKLEHYGWEGVTRKACMNFRWMPPAKLELVVLNEPLVGEVRKFRITNPDECAAAANAQSELDYAELLSVSGYAQLLQLATLFRNESTDPDRSQTVRIFTPDLVRRAQTSKIVTIESEPVPLTPEITVSARREPQKCTASVHLWTQPIKRVLPIEYKIKLRTLKSIWGVNHWREPLYSAFQFVHYEPDLKDRSFMELLIDERDTALDAHLLIEGHSPPDGPRHAAEDAVKLKAHTFDWWIPIKPPFSLEVPLERTEHELRGLGHATTTLDTTMPRRAADVRTMSNPGARFGNTSDVTFENSFPKLPHLDGSQNWEGEHRDPREATVTLKYRLDWDADRMHITLDADPADRNYVVWVVVEEKLQGGLGHVLHTAMPVPINGQLTYVPQSFFDAERAAIEKAAKAASEFNRKYSLSTEVGPDDPVVGWLRPGDLATTSGLTKVLALAEQHQPKILREVLAADQNRSSPD